MRLAKLNLVKICANTKYEPLAKTLASENFVVYGNKCKDVIVNTPHRFDIPGGQK